MSHNFQKLIIFNESFYSKINLKLFSGHSQTARIEFLIIEFLITPLCCLFDSVLFQEGRLEAKMHLLVIIIIRKYFIRVKIRYPGNLKYAAQSFYPKRDMFIPCFPLFFTAWKVSVFEVFLVRIFPHLDWLRRDTPKNTNQKNPEYRHFSRSVYV